MALDIEQFKATQIYSPTAGPDAILADIQALRQFDKEMEAELTKWLIVLILGIVGMIGGIAMAAATQGAMQFVGLGLAGVGLLALIVGIVQRMRLGSYDLENRRYDFVDGLLRLISRDMGKEQALKMKLDLRTPEHNDKFQHEGYAGPWSVKYYVDPWLELQGRLADGTAFSLEAVEKFQARGKWGGRRGNKWKTKNRSSTEMILVLRPKETRYALVEELGRDLYGALRLPPWCQLKLLHMQEGELWLRVTTLAEWEAPNPENTAGRPTFNGVDIAAMMFLSLYQVLNLSRQIRKVQREGGQG